MRRSERIVKATVWGLCVCLGGYLAARGYLHLRQSPGTRAQQILGDICMSGKRICGICRGYFMRRGLLLR